MDNILIVLAGVVAISEVIIRITKDTATKKIKAEVYTAIVLGVVAVFGIGFDIYFNNPTIDYCYVVEGLALIGGSILTGQVGYDKVVELLTAIHKANKKKV